MHVRMSVFQHKIPPPNPSTDPPPHQVEPELAATQLLEAFLELASDDQDSVRLQTVDNCVALAKVSHLLGYYFFRHHGCLFISIHRSQQPVCTSHPPIHPSPTKPPGPAPYPIHPYTPHHPSPIPHQPPQNRCCPPRPAPRTSSP